MARRFINRFANSLAALCVCCMLSSCGQGTDSSSTRGGTSDDGNEAATTYDNTRAQGYNTDVQRAVVAETLAYAEVDNQVVKGHFAFPEDMIDALPAIILIHEWWGLNNEVRALADRIAAEGFVVLAVDLYGGRIADSPVNARKLMLKVVESPDFAIQNIRQACNWVLTTAGAKRVAVIGHGFGGGWSLNAAMDLPDTLDAAVIFYGQVSGNEEALKPVNASILGFFGGADNAIPAETVASFELALQNLGKTHEIEIYPGVKGGFASEGNQHYDANLAKSSWRKMLDFLQQELADTS